MNYLDIQKENIPNVIFLSIFCVLPFLAVLAPITLGFTIVSALLFLPKTHFLETLKSSRISWLMFTYFFLVVLSLTVTNDVGQTVDRIFKNIAFLLLPIAFLLVNPDKKLIQKSAKCFLYALIAFCIFSLLKLGYNYVVRFDESHWYNFIQASMYHKYLPEDAMQLNTGLILLLLGNYSRNMKLLVSILFLIVIVLFGVRLGLSIYLLILGVYFIQNYRLFLNVKTLIVIVLCTGMSFFLIENSRYVNDKFYDTLEKIGFNTGDRVGETGEAYHNINLRSYFWSTSTALIIEKPFFGHGAGMEKRLLDKEFEKQKLDFKGYNSHNQFLSSVFQYGFLGIVILALIFGQLFKKAIRQKNQIVLMILGVMLFSMVTESYLEIQQGLFYFCVMVPFLTYLLKYSIGEKSHE